jgi:SAM-dependent methyltransferase
MAYAAAGGHDLSDPTRIMPKLWPRRNAPAALRILVAGCGANQAAIIAHANPQHSVTGIDLSGKAIEHHARLKERYKLANLELHQIAVEDAGSLFVAFDYIICTGVLHHLVDPAAGLQALAGALAPHGVISAMLYGQNHRAGVYQVQEALRTLGAGRDPAGVSLARDTVLRLPDSHHARPYMRAAPDLTYEAGFVDTFLNARDQAYTVPQILDLVAGSGLQFQGWLDNLYYSPAAAFAPDAQIQDRIYDLPQVEQWHVVDLLAQLTGTHRFLLSRSGPDDDQEGEDHLAAILHRHPDLVVLQGAADNQVRRSFHSFTVDERMQAVLARIDGRTSMRELLAGFKTMAEHEFAEQVLLLLIELDHLFYERPQLAAA